MQWETPELQYPGDITRYEIHLGLRALLPNEEGENIDIDTNHVRSQLFRDVLMTLTDILAYA